METMRLSVVICVCSLIKIIVSHVEWPLTYLELLISTTSNKVDICIYNTESSNFILKV